MSEVLNPQDVDALLASVGADAPAAVPAAPAGVRRAEPSMDDGGPAARYETDVSTYDFKRPKRVSKDQTRALAAIHDYFARNFAATLSGALRTLVNVHVVAVEQVMYSEFVQSLPNPTCFVIMHAPPLEGQMFLEFSPLIVYPMIDRLLGGSSQECLIPQRALTSIEWRLMNRIIDRTEEHLSEAWKNLIDARFEVLETESNPHLVNIVAPTEVVVSITFEVKMATCAGTMSLCIPFNVIESVLGKLATQSWLGYRPKGASDVQQRRLLRNLRKSAVHMTAYLGRARITLRELKALQPGDLLPLDKRVDEPLVLQIEGQNKFAGSAGQFRGRRALHLLRPADPDELL
ncbi:MAG: flagellar motor switch protein FliM [Planctomycetia bacterium]|nr:MAG: flagellar motor switch protein FliM [Planctomycetia bacterium]